MLSWIAFLSDWLIACLYLHTVLQLTGYRKTAVGLKIFGWAFYIMLIAY